MSPSSLIGLTAVLLFGLSHAAVHYPASCCSRYSKTQLTIQVIVGYKEQRSEENCRIDAIIFLTLKRKEVCANPQDEWVKRVLAQLSAKLQKMSRSGVRAVKKPGRPSVPQTDLFVNTTELFLNYTPAF